MREEERENGSGGVCESGLKLQRRLREVMNMAVRRRLAAHRAAVAAIVPCSDRHEYACLAHDPKDLLKRIRIATVSSPAIVEQRSPFGLLQTAVGWATQSWASHPA